jgi:hypothetical protein
MKPRKCKYCKQPFEPSVFLQKNCFDPNCVAEWINDVKQKNWQKKKAKLKLDLMTVQDYIKLAQQVFNKYIRLRDKSSLCISCQKKPLKENAGHFYNANNHWSVRFDERNVHLQCEHCNTFLSGNLIYYRENLLKKIGIEEFENLSAEAIKTRKFTIEELKEIIATYKKKCKELL